jgi:hypothetical protein
MPLMDERYREIYAAIYVDRTGLGPRLGNWSARFDYGGLPYHSEIATAIRDAIEGAESETGVRLREDAKALLAVNLQDLVLYPLAVGGVPLSQVVEDVTVDIRVLTRAAADQLEDGEEAVSGHGIILAASQHWPELRISRFRLWDRSDE